MPIKDLRVDLDPESQTPDIRAKKEALSRILQGNWNTMLKGQGIEFAGFRTYTYEDDASLIDWKASLRTDSVLVREYEEYKTLNVYIMLDVSDTMLFSSTEKLKAEYGAELTFALCDAILKAGDAVGMGMFTDKIEVNIPPNIGIGTIRRIKKELLDGNNYGGPSSLNNILKYLSASARNPALIILISDFLDIEPSWKNYLNIVAQKMDVIGIMIRDPRDRYLPKIGGQFVLEDTSGDGSLIIDTNKVKDMYGAYVQQEEEEIRSAFAKTKSGLTILTTDKDLYDPLLTFFSKISRLWES